MAETANAAHTHYHEGSSSSALGWVLGIIFLGILALALFYYGLPALRGSGGTNVNVPDRIDVNYNPGANPAAR